MQVHLFDNIDNLSRDQVLYYVQSIFKDDALTQTFSQSYDQNAGKITGYKPMLMLLKMILQHEIGWQQDVLKNQFVKILHTLSEHENESIQSVNSYNPTLERPTETFFWPNPTRKNGLHLKDIKPYLKKNKFISKKTPIGSAGSCFAFELSYYLQANGFNYVVCEKATRPEDGVFCETTAGHEQHERFSANYGIMFNSPSFHQLATKSLLGKRLPPLLVHTPTPSTSYYSDPFREDVLFTSVEAYKNDYEGHITATAKALKSCEVFIITMGLNECWEYKPDGSVISRNPSKASFGVMLKHRILTVQENIDHIQAFIDIVTKQNPQIKFIISVSPIPFMATARRDCHVVEANQHSKAVLRVAAEEIVNRNCNAFYFPSYELVMNCAESPWDADLRHVTKPTVAKVMEMFQEMFVQF